MAWVGQISIHAVHEPQCVVVGSSNGNSKELNNSPNTKKDPDFLLINKYTAYQALDDQWQLITVDLEIIKTESFAATTIVNPNMVLKKVNGKDEEVQEGWAGHILPFNLVQQHLLADRLQSLQDKEQKLTAVTAELESLIDELSEEEKEKLLNDSNTSFASSEINKALKAAYKDIETPEILGLNRYLVFLDSKPKKLGKLELIAQESAVNWDAIEANKDGTYGKSAINSYLKTLQAMHQFAADTEEARLVQADGLLIQEKMLKIEIRDDSEALHQLTKLVIEWLDDDTVNELLHLKWIQPLVQVMAQLADDVISDLTRQVRALADKYADTYTATTNELTAAECQLADMIDDLVADEFDSAGLQALQAILKS